MGGITIGPSTNVDDQTRYHQTKQKDTLLRGELAVTGYTTAPRLPLQLGPNSTVAPLDSVLSATVLNGTRFRELNGHTQRENHAAAIDIALRDLVPIGTALRDIAQNKLPGGTGQALQSAMQGSHARLQKIAKAWYRKVQGCVTMALSAGVQNNEGAELTRSHSHSRSMSQSRRDKVYSPVVPQPGTTRTGSQPKSTKSLITRLKSLKLCLGPYQMLPRQPTTRLEWSLTTIPVSYTHLTLPTKA